MTMIRLVISTLLFTFIHSFHFLLPPSSSITHHQHHYDDTQKKAFIHTSSSRHHLSNDPNNIESTSTTTTDGNEETTPALPFPENSQEELLYALGVNLARQLGDIRPLVEDGQELTSVAKGILDCIVGRLDDDQQRLLLARRGTELNELIVERADALRKKVEDMGRSMLQQMSDTEGTVTLDCGVVVHPLEPGPEGFGNGLRPTLASAVKVHYHGTLPDGTVFDSTLAKGGEPATFAIGQVIPGWKEGLLKMHQGETAMLGIPPEMAYGMEGTPEGIPGGATLFFKVQLLEVLSAGIGGIPTLLGADGKKLGSSEDGGGGSGLLGPDGQPM